MENYDDCGDVDGGDDKDDDVYVYKKDVKIHPERRLLRLGLPADNLLIVLLLPPLLCDYTFTLIILSVYFYIFDFICSMLYIKFCLLLVYVEVMAAQRQKDKKTKGQRQKKRILYCDVREVQHNDRNQTPRNLHFSILLSCSRCATDSSMLLDPNAKVAKTCQLVKNIAGDGVPK